MHSFFNRLRSPSTPSNPRPSTSSHSHSNSLQSHSHSHSTGTSPSANTFGNPSVSAGRVSSSRELPASPTSPPLPSPTSAAGHGSVPTSPISESAPPVSPTFQSPSSPSNQTNSPSTITQIPSTPTQSNPGNFTGLRPIAANQDALLGSPPIRSKSPPLIQSPPFSTSPPEASLSPRPATERRGSTSEKKLDLPLSTASPVSAGERTPKPDTIHEENTPPIPTTVSPNEISSTPDEITPMPEGGNLSRSSSRRTTGLFSAVPFTGGTGWSTFGRSRKGRRDSHPTAVGEQEGKLTQTVSRTSSQSRNTSATSKSRTKSSGGTRSPGVSRSGSTKHARKDVGADFGEAGIKEGEGIEHIEQSGYSRIPIHDSHDQRYNKDSNSNSPVTPHSSKQTPSTPHHPSTPRRSSKGETQPPSPTHTHATSPTSPLSRSASEKRNSRLETFPPRTTVVKADEGVIPGSLPFTFGRHTPSKPSVEEIFPGVDEFGASQTQPSREPFPSIGTPISELPANPLDQRKYLPSGSSNTTSSAFASPVRDNIPSLTSDTSNDGTRLEGKDSIPSLATLGGGKLFPSLGSTGDVLSSNDSPVLSERAKELSEERRRIKSIGSGGLVRRSSSGRLLSGGIKRGRSAEALGGITQEPVIVYTAEIPEDQQKRRFPSHDDLPPSSSSDPQEPEASTSQPTSAHRHATSGSATVVGSPSSSEHLHVQAPEVTVQHPTPRPSPARNVSTSSRLAELFNRSNSLRVPEGHAHPSGIGVAGVESHSRRASLKVMGKRRRGDDAEPEEGEVVVYDESRSRRGSNAPSSYQRKRVKLSNASSTEPSTAIARQTSPLAPTNSRHSTAPGTAPSTGSSRPRSMSSTRPKSITSARPVSITSTRPGTSMSKARRARVISSISQSSIPISAIVRPRAPSIHPSVTSRREGDRGQQMRYQNPLHNRYQRRHRRETWADSWTFGGGDLVIQQYLFLAGFVLFPLWWIGVLLPIYRWEDHHQVHWSWLPQKGHDRAASTGSELKGKGREGKPQQPSVGMVDRSNSGLWADPEPYEEEKRRLWRGRCLYAACVGTIFWVIVIVLAIVLAKR